VSRCQRWHAAIPQPGPASTTYAQTMLYLRCGVDLMYVGQRGASCPHEVKELEAK
jgi:hypothetical protein